MEEKQQQKTTRCRTRKRENGERGWWWMRTERRAQRIHIDISSSSSSRQPNLLSSVDSSIDVIAVVTLLSMSTTSAIPLSTRSCYCHSPPTWFPIYHLTPRLSLYFPFSNPPFLVVDPVLSLSLFLLAPVPHSSRWRQWIGTVRLSIIIFLLDMWHSWISSRSVDDPCYHQNDLLRQSNNK